MDAWLSRVEVVVGDITRLSVDAIVNAANESLLGGGGVDGAIHRAAGPRLLEHNRGLGGCRTGHAVRTPAFELEARGVRHLIHTVGPVWGSDPHGDGSEPLGYRLEDNQLGQCYQACLELARAHEVGSIAFPAISTGAYRFPPERAATIAIGHVRAFLAREARPSRVVFCCFDAASAEVYRARIGPLGHDRPIRIGGLGRDDDI